ncbi:MAG: winged helix-turn-helix domain-containing protein [Flavobacteriales bacterium]|nr:winged helix-turn-helix domain-containing protein [Flavobacteriales bacterium]
MIKLDMDAFGFDEKDKRKLAFTISRRDIASAADTTYESVIRALADLQRHGIIGLVGKEIRILKKRELDKVMKGTV